jgi:hypothetical protein
MSLLVVFAVVTVVAFIAFLPVLFAHVAVCLLAIATDTCSACFLLHRAEVAVAFVKDEFTTLVVIARVEHHVGAIGALDHVGDALLAHEGGHGVFVTAVTRRQLQIMRVAAAFRALG